MAKNNQIVKILELFSTNQKIKRLPLLLAAFLQKLEKHSEHHQLTNQSHQPKHRQ